MRFTFLQKMGTALLVTAWVLWSSNMIGDLLVPKAEPPARAARETASAPTSEPAAAEAAEKAVLEDVGPLLTSATVEAGEAVFKKCQSCHAAAKNGAHKVGPNLWNVVGGPTAAKDGYAYSGVLKDLGGTWTYEALNAFLAKPRDFASGTKMTFPGLKKAADRAAVIVYLRAQSDAPVPLP